MDSRASASCFFRSGCGFFLLFLSGSAASGSGRRGRPHAWACVCNLGRSFLLGREKVLRFQLQTYWRRRQLLRFESDVHPGTIHSGQQPATLFMVVPLVTNGYVSLCVRASLYVKFSENLEVEGGDGDTVRQQY